jgi:hypothetical protein
MNPVDDVVAIFENKASFGSTRFAFNLRNNLRARLQIATLGAISLGSGTVNIEGTVNAYFESKATMDRYLNFSITNLAIIFDDATGTSYVVDFPSVKFTSGRRVAGAINTDVIAEMAFTAFRDATEGITVRIARWAA